MNDISMTLFIINYIHICIIFITIIHIVNKIILILRWPFITQWLDGIHSAWRTRNQDKYKKLKFGNFCHLSSTSGEVHNQRSIRMRVFLVLAVALLAISAVRGASLKDFEQQLEEEIFHRGAKAEETDDDKDQSSEYHSLQIFSLQYPHAHCKKSFVMKTCV